MVTSGYPYTNHEWAQAAGHYPLKHLPAEDLALLHRHWMWANQMRDTVDRYEDEFGSGSEVSDATVLATPAFGFLFVWYAMLWAVIEACIEPKEGRNIDLRGSLRSDIDTVAAPLRRFRNAVLHVPATGKYVDERLTSLVTQPESAATMRRIHAGFGRLFLEEFARRQQPVISKSAS